MFIKRKRSLKTSNTSQIIDNEAYENDAKQFITKRNLPGLIHIIDDINHFNMNRSLKQLMLDKVE